MTAEENLFYQIGNKMEGSEQSQMFGKACFKNNKKAFICFFEMEMVFKLSAKNLPEALALEGSHLFDPSGKNRPMKEWVQIPFVHSDSWEKYAHAALDYLKSKQG